MGEENKEAFQAITSKINGIPTEFIFNRFTNKYFILITQYQKMTNLFTVKFDLPTAAAAARGIPDQIGFSQPLTIAAVFGKDDDETRGAIQFLVTSTNLKMCPNEILFSLGLKEINRNILKEIATIVNNLVK